MRIGLLNAVLLAQDFARLRDWWIEVVGLELIQEWTERHHYAELGYDGDLVLGIADAAEMRAALPTPRANGAIPQLRVDDVKAFLERLQAGGAKVIWGPSYDEQERFWCGAFLDREGNQVWVVSPPESQSR